MYYGPIYTYSSPMDSLGNLIQIIILGLFLLIVCRMIIGAGSFLARELSSERGYRRSLELQRLKRRHRLESQVKWMAIGCLILGVYLSVNGHLSGALVIRIFGDDFVVENAGVGVLLFGMSFLFIWMLLRFTHGSGESSPGSTDPMPAEIRPTSSDGLENWLAGLTYTKAMWLTLLSLVIIGPLGLPLGGFVFFKAWSNKNEKINNTAPAELDTPPGTASSTPRTVVVRASSAVAPSRRP